MTWEQLIWYAAVAVICWVAGAVMALLCTLLSVLPASLGIIPINAITPIIGVPVIIYIILNRRKLQYFN